MAQPITNIPKQQLPIFSLNQRICGMSLWAFSGRNVLLNSVAPPGSFVVEIDHHDFEPRFYPGAFFVVSKYHEVMDQRWVLVHQHAENSVVIKQYYADGNDALLVDLVDSRKTSPMSKNDEIIGVVIEAHQSFNPSED